MSMSRIDTAALHALLRYDAENGLFYRNRNGKLLAGYKQSKGYRATDIKGRGYYLHRLAWQYVYGEVPDFQIDHINGDPADNRIANLRKATQQQNSGNMKMRGTNSSGRKGVYFHKPNGKWVANIHLDYKTRYLGSFESKDAASMAYEEAAREAFGEFTRLS